MKISHKLILLFFIILSAVSNNFAQSKGMSYLEITGSASTDTVRGGEKFFYTFTVTNLSEVSDKNVVLADHSNSSRGFADGMLLFVSVSASQGRCEVNEDSSYDALKYFSCEFGEIQGYASASVTIEVKLKDWGDISETPEAKRKRNSGDVFTTVLNGRLKNDSPRLTEDQRAEAERSQKRTQEELDEAEKAIIEGSHKLELSYPHIYACACEEKKDDVAKSINIKAFPSKNIPPRIELISPKEDSVFTKPLNKNIEIPVFVKAFDPDGRIEKVIVEGLFGGKTRHVLEGNQVKYLVNGKTYTENEFRRKLAEDKDFQKSAETYAELTGKDTYKYVIKNFTYGENYLHLAAIDNLGRNQSVSFKFKVKRDAEVEIVAPSNNQVFRPGASIKIETNSLINDSERDDLKIFAIWNYSDIYSLGMDATSFIKKIPSLERVSKVGNTFRHRYIWKPQKEGKFDLRVESFGPDNLANLKSDSIRVYVAEARDIKIASIKNGQEFREGEAIRILVDALDIKGTPIDDELELLIDGKRKEDIYNSLGYDANPPNQRLVRNESSRRDFYLEKGTHTFQVIARPYRSSEAVFGKSEIITIKVK